MLRRQARRGTGLDVEADRIAADEPAAVGAGEKPRAIAADGRIEQFQRACGGDAGTTVRPLICRELDVPAGWLLANGRTPTDSTSDEVISAMLIVVQTLK